MTNAGTHNPVFERVSGLMMIGAALCVLITPKTIEMGAFKFMLDVGLTPTPVFLILIVFGALRFAAVRANGRWRHGTRLRALCCGVGALMWAQMGAALVMLTQDTGTLSLGIPVYAGLTWLEVVACGRVARTIQKNYGVTDNVSFAGSQRSR